MPMERILAMALLMIRWWCNIDNADGTVDDLVRGGFELFMY